MSRWSGFPDAFPSSRQKPSRRSAGFTLLEVVVAFTCMALVLGALLQVFSGGMRALDGAARYSAAAQVAASTLAAVGTEIPLEAGDWDGETDDSFRWRANIVRYTDLVETSAEDLDETLIPLLVTVVVGWGPDGKDGSVTVSTLRLAPVEVSERLFGRPDGEQNRDEDDAQDPDDRRGER